MDFVGHHPWISNHGGNYSFPSRLPSFLSNYYVAQIVMEPGTRSRILEMRIFSFLGHAKGTAELQKIIKYGKIFLKWKKNVAQVTTNFILGLIPSWFWASTTITKHKLHSTYLRGGGTT